MQILLAILIAAAASKVQSAGFACSKCPILSNLYSLAQNISGKKIPESEYDHSGGALFQQFTDKIMDFKKKYEVAETEVDCKSLLCDQKLQLLNDEEVDRPTESSKFDEYDYVHEMYVEQLGRDVYNLSSEYCQAAEKKMKEIVNLSGPLINELFKFIHDSRFGSSFDQFYNSICIILAKFSGADRYKCRFLNPEFLNCVGRDFSEDYFKALPQEVQNHIDNFLELCSKNKNELESMKGPGIDCD